LNRHAGPGPAWIRRRTNVEDLLDDGVENGSDLVAGLPEAEEPLTAEEEVALDKREQTLAAVRAEQAEVTATIRRRAFSPYGVAFGLLIAAGGAWLIANPVDMRVEHRRMRYLPTFREHVTPARSRFYGAAGLVSGLALIGYSLRRPS
jgi:hypothetical protein